MQTMSELNEMGCDEFADVAAELALGVLTGRERAQALMHLDQCDACRESVRQMTMTGEELLGLLPASEPPPGFETRVMERIGLPTPSPRPVSHISHARRKGQVSRTRRMLAVAAVVAAFVVTGLGGWGLHAATTSPPASALSSATLLSASHQAVGKIYVYNGSSWWMYMSVAMDTGNVSVTCQLEGADGRITTVGSFKLTDGYGYWGSPVPANLGPVTGARLISADGNVVATASISG
jgi:anti-sigma-K factor RskA